MKKVPEDVQRMLYDLRGARLHIYRKHDRKAHQVYFQLRTWVPEEWLNICWGSGQVSPAYFRCSRREAIAIMCRTLLLFPMVPYLRTRLELLLALIELRYDSEEVLPWLRIAWDWSPKPQLRKRNNEGTYDNPE